jgi:hypothetical protein
MKFIPETLIDDVATEEGWTDVDRQDWETLRNVLEEMHGVGTLQRDSGHDGLHAYNATSVNYLPVKIDTDDPKPFLRAARDLSWAFSRIEHEAANKGSQGD